MSPESLFENKYSIKSDVFSFAVVSAKTSTLKNCDCVFELRSEEGWFVIVMIVIITESNVCIGDV